MLHKAYVRWAAVGLVCILFFSGCNSSEKRARLKFVPRQTTRYRATADVVKDYRFEQPTLGKLTQQQTKNSVVMEYSQDVQNVDENGNATLKITIDQLKINTVKKNTTQFTFDSQNKADQKKPLMKLIGQSYTIRMTPQGKVKVVDTKKAMASVASVYEKNIVRDLLNPMKITARHEIPAMPDNPAVLLSKNSSWKRVVPSPPGLLTPKSYEKVYTVTGVKNNIATVRMTATESAAPAKATSTASGMGIFAKMFDNKDDYTGSMQFDIAAGQVIYFEETLVSTYLAQEMPENGDPEKGPDTLMMGITNRIKLEKLD